jgi:hypothetical protein
MPVHYPAAQGYLPQPLLHQHHYIVKRSEKLLKELLYMLLAGCKLQLVELADFKVGKEPLHTTTIIAIWPGCHVWYLQPMQVVFGPLAGVVASTVEEEDVAISPCRSALIQSLHQLGEEQALGVSICVGL